MKQIRLFVACVLCWAVWAVHGYAQTYEHLWKEVETLRQKDLPASVLEVVARIRDKARAERCLPQLMKAVVVTAEQQAWLQPDSLPAARAGLEAWAAAETDTVARAVLEGIVGGWWLEGPDKDTDAALRHFRKSVEARAALRRTPASDYRPMTCGGKLSQHFFDDNLYDLLVRHAIHRLSGATPWADRPKALKACWDLYDGLAACYEAEGNRTAALLTREAQLWFRLDRMGHLRGYGLTDEEAERQLTELARQAAGLPVEADAYLKLAEWYLRHDERAKAVAAADKGLERCGTGEGAGLLKRCKRFATRPGLSVELPFVYPQQTVAVKVRFANLPGLTLEMYRLEATPASAQLHDRPARKLYDRRGRKVTSAYYPLEPAADFRYRDTVLHLRLPEAGIYVLRQVPKGYPASAACQLVYVSPYEVLSLPVDTGHKEYTVMDKLTGHPVPGASLAVYVAQGKGYRLQQEWATGQDGTCLLANTHGAPRWMNARVPGCDYMPLARLEGATPLRNRRPPSWRQRQALFTDRGLYRAGQTVRVSGTVFRQLADSVAVAGDVRQTVRLLSETGELAQQTVRTDEWGVWATEFVLPKTLRPGTYRLTTEGGQTAIRVEEYRRPTFEVTFTPAVATYAPGDTVGLTAVARTLAGVPVRAANVRWHLTRTERSWFRPMGGDKAPLQEGEGQTDADGKFTVKVVLTAPERLSAGQYCMYRMEADVTDMAGETRQAVLDLPAGRVSMGLLVEHLPEVVQKERLPELMFRAVNLRGEPVGTMVDYRVRTLDAAGQPGAERRKGTVQAQQPLVPSDWASLPSGRYRLELSATDGQGRSCTAEQDFVLFAAADGRVPYATDAWFWQDGQEFSADAPVTLYVGTTLHDVYLLMDIYSGDRRIESRRLSLDDELQTFRLSYQEAYGDGVTVHLAFVKQGQLYRHDARILRARPDKRLSLKWATFRDRLQPGAAEEWRLQVTDTAGQPVRAALMATLYDAALDELLPYRPFFSLDFPREVPYVWATVHGGRRGGMTVSDFPYEPIGDGLRLQEDGDYSRLYGSSLGWPDVRIEMANAPAMMPMMKAAATARADAGVPEVAVPPVRTRLAETAFFSPWLRTDSAGTAVVTFTVPDALTRWRFIGWAHTAGMRHGQLTAIAVTQKELMLQPNLPRFVRRGDKAVIAASLANQSQQARSGKAYMELKDPATERVLGRWMRPFKVAGGATGLLRFECRIPEGHDLLVCRLWADAGTCSDGEQRWLPVLTDRQPVTETATFRVTAAGPVTVDLKELSRRAPAERRLTLELTAHPAWQVVQALPVIGQPQTDDALAWMTAYYAGRLAQAVVEAHPRIGSLLEAERHRAGTDEAGWGQLEQRQDLKDLLLEETPWQDEAREETQRLRRLALLLETATWQTHRQEAVRRLRELQQPDGAWSWYKGMAGNRYMTLRMTGLLARLRALGLPLEPEVEAMYHRAFGFLKQWVGEEYRSRKKEPSGNRPAGSILHYLYLCAVDPSLRQVADRQANDFFLKEWERHPAGCTLREKAMMATVLQEAGRPAQAAEWVRSLKEYLTGTAGTGYGYDTPRADYTWESGRIPTQVAAMEAIWRIAPDPELLDGMRLWLFRQKQVQAWESPVATADAVYAFLSLGSGDPLEQEGRLVAVMDGRTLETPADARGYVRRTWTGGEAQAGTLQVTRQGTGTGWGNVYLRYWEDMDQVRPDAGNGLHLVREYWRGTEQVTAGTRLQVGDRLTVRLRVTADRDMDFVQLRDERAACLEPADPLSGYWATSTTGYYRMVRDASTLFFMDKLRKGTHVLEYDVFLDRSGRYVAGAAVVQSAYAPEYTGHTAGGRLTVEERKE